MSHHPPKLPRRIFEWLAGKANIDDLLGDLDELFYLHLETMSPRKAKALYWKQVLSLSFSYAVRKRKRDARYGGYSASSFSIDMMRNYFKVAVRNLYQYRYFSTLNAFGLAIGMSVSLLLISIYGYVRTYDNFHQHKNNIYTVISHQRDGVEESDYATAPQVLAEKIKAEFSGAEEVLRITKGYDNQVVTEKENIPVKAYYVEPEFFSVFTFEVVQGNAAALAEPNNIILTESTAMKLFNSHDVIGQTLTFDGGATMQVAGLMKDHPLNSHLNFEILISHSSIPHSQLFTEDRWTNYPKQYVYILLGETTSSEHLQQYLNKVASQTYAQTTVKVSFALQPLKEIATGGDLLQAIGTKWEMSGFLMFAVFAALILLPACFNYTNISIARALRRAKEIGLRKTMGGAKSQIFLQFITETIIITLLSLLGSLLIFVLIRSEFQRMMVAGSSLDLSINWRMLLMFTAFAVVTGLIAGIFPALHFARLTPIQALKSKINTRGTFFSFRKILTVFQFALSFGFILALVVFGRQYQYSMNFDFGFEKKNTLDVELQDVDPSLFKNAYAGLTSVQSLSMSSGLLGVNASRTWAYTTKEDSTEAAQMFIDTNYIENFGLTFLAGKNFPDDGTQRERYIIVNEEFLKTYKIDQPRDALGRVFTIDNQDLEVIGVLKNFHYEPLMYPIGKFFFRMKKDEFVYANLQVASHDTYRLFTQLEDVWKQLPTQKKFKARYFEDELNEAYQTYQVLLKIVAFLGLLAITISLLGMLGMVVYTTENKTKEVSVRKVLGASVANISLLLSKDYLKMMGWAMVFAIPLTVFLLDFLLTEIQYYSVQLSVWDILVSSLILLTLGVVTITSQTYKTATRNPAEMLRME